MDIMSTEGTTYKSPLKLKVGGALIFKRVEDWKMDLKNSIVPACEAVRRNRARSDYRSRVGDIFYASLVHAIVALIDSYVHQRKPISACEVNLPLLMSSTGVWKEGAELDTIVEVAARFLSLYNGVDPSDKHLKSMLLVDFEIVWREVIDEFLSTHPMLYRDFSDGGYLIQELIDPESYSTLRAIRKRVRQRGNGAAGSSSTSGMSASTAEKDGQRGDQFRWN